MVGTRSLVTVVINNGRVLAETLLKKNLAKSTRMKLKQKNLFNGRWSLHKNRANTSRYSNAPLRHRMFPRG